jgi:hypothetical protein
MTDDPKRWLDGGDDATTRERDLLESVRDPEPPDAARAAVWAALATRLPPPPSGGGGAGGAGAAKGGLGVLSKIIGGIVIATALAGGGVFAVRARSTTPRTTPTIALAPTTTEAPPTVASGDVPSPSPPPPSTATDAPLAPIAPKTSAAHRHTTPSSHGAAPSPSATSAPAHTSEAPETPSSKPTEAPRADALREESALVGRARDALRRGDTKTALTLVEEARTRFPQGILVQEREVVAIEALAKGGDADGASRRASAFLRAFPSSPHTAHVRSFVR